MLYNIRSNVILLSVKCYITFSQMLYYFQSNVILLSVRNYITSLRKFLYFLSEIPLLSLKNTSTFAQKYLYFCREIPLLFRGSRGISERACNYLLKVSELHPVLSAVISRAKWRYFRSRLKAIALGVSSAWVRLNLHSRVGVLEIHPSPQVRSARGGLMGPSQHKANEQAIRYWPHRPCSHGREPRPQHGAQWLSSLRLQPCRRR